MRGVPRLSKINGCDRLHCVFVNRQPDWSIQFAYPRYEIRVSRGGSRGVTWVMTLPLGPGAPQACQGHHGIVRGTSAPQACQGHHRLVRGTTELPSDTTYLSGAPQACQEHHRPSMGTSQRHHGTVGGTTGLSGASPVQQGHHRPARGITGLSGAPQSLPACQGHHRPARGTSLRHGNVWKN